MKAYTDLEQSKKLAKILPLESADMIWILENPDLPTIKAIPYEDSDYNNKYLNIIPAWSLAALLGVLQYPTLFQNGDEEWGCTAWIDTTKPYSISPKDNPVDACYELILKLNELNLL